MSLLINSKSRTSAFTLIELLVVIAIIGILVSLTSVGVMKILNRSQMVTARIEIGQLEAAISAAKLGLGNVDELPSMVRLYNTSAGFSGDASFGVPTYNFLIKAFGKSWTTNPTYPWMGPSYTGTYPVTLTGMEALVFWLGGIQDSNGNFQGFSSKPSTPWDSTTSKRKGPFFEFKQKQITQTATYYTMLNPFGGSYAYISSGDYKHFLGNPLGGIIYPYHKTSSGAVPSSSYYNSKTFQLISSGQDKAFGLLPPNTSANPNIPGGYYNAPYPIGSPGFDDLSNFSSLQLGARE